MHTLCSYFFTFVAIILRKLIFDYFSRQNVLHLPAIRLFYLYKKKRIREEFEIRFSKNFYALGGPEHDWAEFNYLHFYFHYWQTNRVEKYPSQDLSLGFWLSTPTLIHLNDLERQPGNFRSDNFKWCWINLDTCLRRIMVHEFILSFTVLQPHQYIRVKGSRLDVSFPKAQFEELSCAELETHVRNSGLDTFSVCWC